LFAIAKKDNIKNGRRESEMGTLTRRLAAFGGRLMPKRVIGSPMVAESTLPLSQATLAGDVLYIGAVVAYNARGELVGKGDIHAQTRQVLENVQALVEAAGGTLLDVTRTTVYLTDLANYAGMNEIYATYFPVDPPSRATVRVDLANPDFLVAIEATAVVG
jgi:reactive intermediate/imine deaminase